MRKAPSVDAVFEIFSQLNAIPRPSHHEERVADFLCRYAEGLHLEYERDGHNCVVIRKPASPGMEEATPVVLLNHMDMVCVGFNDRLHYPVQAYVDGPWMKARGTSLGADNGIGLSMALAVLADDGIAHGPLEVMTTTNEEDGMSGAAHLPAHFLKGRRVINLDSEDYDTITTGAAGACLQEHRLPVRWVAAPGGKRRWYRITIGGLQGGHSGVDINRGRASATVLAWAMLAAIYNEVDLCLASLTVGEANASIAASAEMVVTVASGEAAEFVKAQEGQFNEWLREEYGDREPTAFCRIEKVGAAEQVADEESLTALLRALEQIPQGVVAMSDTLPDTVHTSNNVGRVTLTGENFVVTTHTRSFSDGEMGALAKEIREVFAEQGGSSTTIMEAPAWQENPDSDFLRKTSDVFQRVLGWRPRPVAMHFVLEAGYFVRKFPGMEIACIGPRILEPHSVNERVELSTVADIWRVLIALLDQG